MFFILDPREKLNSIKKVELSDTKYFIIMLFWVILHPIYFVEAWKSADKRSDALRRKPVYSNKKCTQS